MSPSFLSYPDLEMIWLCSLHVHPNTLVRMILQEIGLGILTWTHFPYDIFLAPLPLGLIQTNVLYYFCPYTPHPSPKQTTMQIPLHIRPKKAVKTFPNPFRRHSINLARRSIKFNQPLIKFNHSSINLDQSQSTFNRIQSDSFPGPGIHPRTHPSLTPCRPLFSLTFPPLFGTFWPM